MRRVFFRSSSAPRKGTRPTRTHPSDRPLTRRLSTTTTADVRRPPRRRPRRDGRCRRDRRRRGRTDLQSVPNGRRKSPHRLRHRPPTGRRWWWWPPMTFVVSFLRGWNRNRERELSAGKKNHKRNGPSAWRSVRSRCLRWRQNISASLRRRCPRRWCPFMDLDAAGVSRPRPRPARGIETPGPHRPAPCVGRRAEHGCCD